MKLARLSNITGDLALLFTAAVMAAPAVATAEGVTFIKPNRGSAPAAQKASAPAASSTLQFRSASAGAEQPAAAPKPAAQPAAVQPATHQQVAKPLSQAPK